MHQHAPLGDGRMLAATAGPQGFLVERVPIPTSSPSKVLIEVSLAGLCRTDLWLASGQLPLKQQTILGHEFCGTVIESPVPALQGKRVAVFPFVPCGQCRICAHTPKDCPHKEMLGWKHPGAFARYICVPTSLVYPISPALSWERAAYAEPVAASLACVGALKPGMQGWIWGTNRIAQLTQRCLQQAGFDWPMGLPSLQEQQDLRDHLDVVIETQCPPQGFAPLIDLLKPRGLLMVKSRRIRADLLPTDQVVYKNLRIEGVSYAPFEEALKLLERQDFLVEDLFGKTWSMTQAQDFMTQGLQSESLKLFLDPR